MIWPTDKYLHTNRFKNIPIKNINTSKIATFSKLLHPRLKYNLYKTFLKKKFHYFLENGEDTTMMHTQPPLKVIRHLQHLSIKKKINFKIRDKVYFETSVMNEELLINYSWIWYDLIICKPFLWLLWNNGGSSKSLTSQYLTRGVIFLWNIIIHEIKIMLKCITSITITMVTVYIHYKTLKW